METASLDHGVLGTREISVNPEAYQAFAHLGRGNLNSLLMVATYLQAIE